MQVPPLRTLTLARIASTAPGSCAKRQNERNRRTIRVGGATSFRTSGRIANDDPCVADSRVGRPPQKRGRMSDPQDRLKQAAEALTVSLAQRGDEGAFRRLVDLYDRRLLYFARRLLGSGADAPGVVQTVWLQVHRRLGKLASPRAFRVWIYRIAHAEVVNDFRRRNVPVASLEQAGETVLADANAEEIRFESAELVHVAMEHLSIEHRRVLVLFFLEEMSIEEIASVLESPPGTIKSRLHYAKAALKRQIEELGR